MHVGYTYMATETPKHNGDLGHLEVRNGLTVGYLPMKYCHLTKSFCFRYDLIMIKLSVALKTYIKMHAS